VQFFIIGLQLVRLHDQNKSGFFGGPAFIQPVRAIWKVFKRSWLAGKKPALQKSHFCFDHVNRLNRVHLRVWVRSIQPPEASSMLQQKIIELLSNFRTKICEFTKIPLIVKPVYMIKAKVAFVEGRLLSSHSEQFKKYSKSSDWLEKSWP